MSKDGQTNLAGFIGGLAIIAQWIAGKWGIDLGITADFLSAIALVAGLVIAWYIGKTGNNTKPEQDKILGEGK